MNHRQAHHLAKLICDCLIEDMLKYFCFACKRDGYVQIRVLWLNEVGLSIHMKAINEKTYSGTDFVDLLA